MSIGQLVIEHRLTSAQVTVQSIEKKGEDRCALHCGDQPGDRNINPWIVYQPYEAVLAAFGAATEQGKILKGISLETAHSAPREPVLALQVRQPICA